MSSDFNSARKLKKLLAERLALFERVKAVRAEFLTVRARKNYLESRLDSMGEQITALQQGQLCLGDQTEESA